MKEKNIDPTEDILSVEDAKALITFVFQTNYQVMSQHSGPFDNMDKALAFINSDEYVPEELLLVCFATAEDMGESVFVNRDAKGWWVDDGNMGGKSANGDTIEEALRNFRNEFAEDATDRPVELVVKP